MEPGSQLTSALNKNIDSTNSHIKRKEKKRTNREKKTNDAITTLFGKSGIMLFTSEQFGKKWRHGLHP